MRNFQTSIQGNLQSSIGLAKMEIFKEASKINEEIIKINRELFEIAVQSKRILIPSWISNLCLDNKYVFEG